MKTTTAILLVLFLVGCGKKGNPSPPVPIIPRATTDLSVAQQGPTVVLRFSYPSMTSAGERLPSLDGISILRYTEPLPPTLVGRNPEEVTPGEVRAGEPPEAALFRNVPLPPPRPFLALSSEIGSLDASELPAVTVGAEVLFTDNPPIRGEGGVPVRHTYAVVAKGPGGPSELSNLVSIVPVAAAVAPSGLSAEARASDVLLQWQAPEASVIAGASPTLVGYNIYRFPEQGEIAELGNPLNASPIAETSFSDSPGYGLHRYMVTAVSTSGPPLIQSEPTSSILVEFRDRVAPPPPPEVITLAEDGAVRLLWDAVEAPDLAGYLVYRLSEARERVILTPKPITDTNFRDADPPRGVTYTYWVSSVDTQGNEGAAKESAPVLVAR